LQHCVAFKVRVSLATNLSQSKHLFAFQYSSRCMRMPPASTTAPATRDTKIPYDTPSPL